MNQYGDRAHSNRQSPSWGGGHFKPFPNTREVGDMGDSPVFLEVENQSKAGISHTQTQTDRHTDTHTDTQCRFLWWSVQAQMCQIMSFFLNATLQYWDTHVSVSMLPSESIIFDGTISTVQNYPCVLRVLENVQCLRNSVLFLVVLGIISATNHILKMCGSSLRWLTQGRICNSRAKISIFIVWLTVLVFAVSDCRYNKSI